VTQSNPTGFLSAARQFEGLKRLEMTGHWLWTESDVEMISRIPLKSLKIGGYWTAETIRPLINCKTLKRLFLYDQSSTNARPIYLSSLLRGIGSQLRSLTIISRISHELTSQIPELCPNLEDLLVSLPRGCVPGQVVMEKRFRSEMKRLGVVSLPEAD
jgi:hypothetical protein